LVSIDAKLAPMVNLFTSDGEKLITDEGGALCEHKQPFLHFVGLKKGW